MAEAILRNEGGFEVRSAGVAADNGSKASPQAVQVVAKRGIDLTTHRSSLLSSEHVSWADIILTMTRRHKDAVLEQFPQAAEKVHTLKEFALQEADQLVLTEKLHSLFRSIEQKRQAFTAASSPTIGQLQVERARLLEELGNVEHRLAELQARLRAELQPERAEIAQLESFMSSPDVADPFGRDESIYAECLAEITNLIQHIIPKLKPSLQ